MKMNKVALILTLGLLTACGKEDVKSKQIENKATIIESENQEDEVDDSNDTNDIDDDNDNDDADDEFDEEKTERFNQEHEKLTQLVKDYGVSEDAEEEENIEIPEGEDELYDPDIIKAPDA